MDGDKRDREKPMVGDPVFAGEHIALPNGWRFERDNLNHTGWHIFTPNGAMIVGGWNETVARAFAASFSASAGMEAFRPLFDAWTYQLRGHENSPTSSIWQSWHVVPLTYEQYHAAKDALNSPRVALPTAQGVPDELRALEALRIIRELAAMSRGIACDLSSAHSGRGPGANSEMRSDDRDQRERFDALAKAAKGFAARAAVSSSTAPGQEEE